MERLLRTLPSTSGTSKGDNGRVGIIGGSVEFPSQPVLSGLAAVRTGSDVVKLLVSEEIHASAASHSPDLLVGRYDGRRFTAAEVDRAIELGEWADALVVGPGFVDADDDAIREVVDGVDVPVVVDALAIAPALDADLSETVFTPDEEEKGRITEEYDSLASFSTETGAVVVLTGDVDRIIADGEEETNETGTSALTVAGTGDTLAGIIASLIGQDVDRADAAELGAWVIGKSGELAAADYGKGVAASDVIERIPDTIR